MREQLVQAIETDYLLIDDIPEVAEARADERMAAELLLAQRRATYSGVQAELPNPVDALSTAQKVLSAKQEYGEHSVVYYELNKGLQLDCQRLVAEWYRKNKPEYFPASRHIFNDQTEEFFSHGLSIRQMTENALLPIGDDPEEEQRRINERVEDATPQVLRNLGKIAIGEEAVRTISECTDSAIASYEEDMRMEQGHRGYRGYVPEIQKLMIRDIRLDDASNDRFEEQVGLPGIYITHDIIQMALAEKGAPVDALNKTQLHGSQLKVNDGLMDFVAQLDRIASDQWCTNIFMGEVVPSDYVKDYEAFKQEALERQAGQAEIAQEVATFVLFLAEDSTETGEALQLVEEFVKIKLLNASKQDLEIAEHMFDKKTADGLRQVMHLENGGHHDEAIRLMQEVEQAAPGGGFCGAGSCGLESVKLEGKELDELKDNLNFKGGETLTHDTERSCNSCKKRGGIYYSHTVAKVKKFCTCGAKQV